DLPASRPQDAGTVAVQGIGARPGSRSGFEQLRQMAEDVVRLVDEENIGVPEHRGLRSEQPLQGAAMLLPQQVVRLVLRRWRPDPAPQLLDAVSGRTLVE